MTTDKRRYGVIEVHRRNAETYHLMIDGQMWSDAVGTFRGAIFYRPRYPRNEVIAVCYTAYVEPERCLYY